MNLVSWIDCTGCLEKANYPGPRSERRGKLLKVSVRLFAIYREKLGQGRLDVQLDQGSRVGDLARWLEKAYPSLKLSSGSLVIAVNSEYASPSQVLKEGDEVALIPPVSGGAR